MIDRIRIGARTLTNVNVDDVTAPKLRADATRSLARRLDELGRRGGGAATEWTPLGGLR
jgi:hypothetical protein